MMESNFKYGDRVWAGKHPGKIVSIRDIGGKYTCTVKFDDTNLMPSEMDYEEKHLKLEFSPDKHCPICGSEYKVVKFNMHVWKDCSVCEDKKENLEQRHAQEKYNKPNKNEEDLLKEFEKMLKDDEYDDDFFTFDSRYRGIYD